MDLYKGGCQIVDSSQGLLKYICLKKINRQFITIIDCSNITKCSIIYIITRYL